MGDIISNLTWYDVEELFKLPKDVKDKNIVLMMGKKNRVGIKSKNGEEEYLMDIWGKRNKKLYCHHMHKQNLFLRGLCLSGDFTHTNPEVLPPNVPKELINILTPYVGKPIGCPHVHLQVNFNRRWAVPAEEIFDIKQLNMLQKIIKFFDYCNVDNNYNITSDAIAKWLYD